ncbi:MAG: rod-binding protein [Peptococcaceae bacterium]|jgi:flagellar protein FlgJ|nr:rod-binding protein [Peptococcaceae bacterium]
MMINSLAGSSPAAASIETGVREKESGDFQRIIRQVQQEKDDKKLKEACRDIEAVFIHLMLRQMRSAIPQGGLLPESSAAKMYRDMLDESYSSLIAGSRDSLGLADMLYRQLKEQAGESK